MSENKSIVYQYDISLNLSRMVDKNGNSILYTYDNRNLMLSRNVPQTGDNVGYSYDELGNRQSMTDSTGLTTYSYNENNWMTGVIKEGAVQVGYTYDDVGNILTITDKKGFVTTYTYDKSSRMKTVSFNGRVTTYNYDINGNRESINYQGTTEVFDYDRVNRLKSVTNKRADQSIISSYSYTYYDNGLHKSKTDTYGTTNFKYDSDGRVTEVSAPGKLTTYFYDNSGNRQTMTETHISDQPSGYTDEAGGSEVRYRIKATQYDYSDANKLLRVTEYMRDASGNEVLQKATRYIYDNNGNQLSENAAYLRNASAGSTVTLGLFNYDVNTTAQIDSKINITNNEFDGFNRLKKVETLKSGKRTVTEYTYNGDDLRVTKTTAASANNYVPQVTYYLYDRQHVILETDSVDSVKARFIRGINYIYKTQKVYYILLSQKSLKIGYFARHNVRLLLGFI